MSNVNTPHPASPDTRVVQRICVFCGSRPGLAPAFLDAAAALGRELVERGLGLVYGGARIGLMGRIADTVLAGGGEVIGVMPVLLSEREMAHRGLTELRIVATMHERKSTMAALADAFIALPGGLGTLEEIFEAVTWSQLRLHDKPCGLLNVAGYYDGLHAFMEHAAECGFVGPESRSLLIDADCPATLIDRLIVRSTATDRTA